MSSAKKRKSSDGDGLQEPGSGAKRNSLGKRKTTQDIIDIGPASDRKEDPARVTKKAKKQSLGPVAEQQTNEEGQKGNPETPKSGKRPRKRRASRTNAEAAIHSGAEQPATEDGSAQPKKRKRRSRSKAPAADVPEEERKRRDRQRQLRKLALEARAEGKKYKPPKKRAATDAAKAKAAKPEAKPKAKAGKPDAKAGKKEETGTRPEGDVDVIVVPIYWNRKPEEKARVVDAAEGAAKLLQGAGVATGVDTTNLFSPGQKFAFWEHKGVKVRIECGPKEADRGQCVLAVTTTAGSVAQKRTFSVGPELVAAVGKALQRQLAAGAAPEEGAAAAMEVDEKPSTSTERVAPVSGDDLGGDFAGIEIDADDSKKKKRKK